MTTHRTALALVTFLLLAGAPRQGAAQGGDVAVVNGVGISADRAERYLLEYLGRKGRGAEALRQPDDARKYRRESLDQLVDEELLWQEAVRLGFVATKQQVDDTVARARRDAGTPDEFAARLARAGLTETTFLEHTRRQVTIQNLLERKVWKGISVSDADVHAWYVKNPDRFKAAEEIRVRHILIPAGASMPAETRAHARRDAERIRTALLGGADFAELARTRSKDADTAAKGGDLGWVERGKMLPEFESAAFALRPGEISKVIETSLGFHVVRVDERRGGEVTPEAKAREEIRRYLLGEKRRAASRAEIDALRATAKITYAGSP